MTILPRAATECSADTTGSRAVNFHLSHLELPTDIPITCGCHIPYEILQERCTKNYQRCPIFKGLPLPTSAEAWHVKAPVFLSEAHSLQFHRNWHELLISHPCFPCPFKSLTSRLSATITSSTYFVVFRVSLLYCQKIGKQCSVGFFFVVVIIDPWNQLFPSSTQCL